MRKILTGALLSVMVFAPLAANAQQDTASLQAQAQALLQQVQQLEAQLAAAQSTQTTGSGGTVTTVNASNCPNIGRSLSLGSTGSDVSNLQTFLAVDPTVYPEAQVTGYFGVLTQAAVRRFQTKYNVVSSGNPQTTGYGVVGPRTAAVIALVCTQRSTTTTGATAPTVGGYIQVTPINGSAPLTVNVTANINTTNSCTGATYVLNFGDGSQSQQMVVQPNNCSPQSQTFSHTYTSPGTYQVVLASGTHQTSATVTVLGQATAAVQDSLGASITSGPAPLNVTFIGTVSGGDAAGCSSSCDDTLKFGDGTQGLVPLPSAGLSQSFSIGHNYLQAGSASAQLLNPAGSVVAQPVTITISAGSSSGSGSQPVSGTYGIVSITPGVGGNPLAISAQLSVPCSVYSVDWGDGTISPNAGTSGVCTTGSASSPTVNHSYTQGGSYTIKLEDGSGAVQATGAITISN